jgi:hypothetical protein
VGLKKDLETGELSGTVEEAVRYLEEKLADVYYLIEEDLKKIRALELRVEQLEAKDRFRL